MANFPVQLNNTVSSDISGSIASGGTAQNLFTSSSNQIGFSIHNLDLNNDLWINIGGTAAPFTAGSMKIPPLALYETPNNMILVSQSVSIYGLMTGQIFTAKKY